MSWSRRGLLGGLAALCVAGGRGAEAGHRRVMVLHSRADRRERTIAEAFRRQLPDVGVVTLDLGTQPAAARGLSPRLDRLDIDVVLALGELAGRVAARSSGSQQVLLVDPPQTGGPITRPHTHTLRPVPDPEAALLRLADCLRPLDTLGLIRTPATASTVARVAEAGRAVGLRVVVDSAKSPAELAAVSESLLRGTQLLWLFRDENVLPADTLAQVQRAAATHGRALATWSPAHLTGRAPALLAVHVGPSGHGEAAGLRARAWLAGQSTQGPAEVGPLISGHIEGLAALGYSRRRLEGLASVR